MPHYTQLTERALLVDLKAKRSKDKPVNTDHRNLYQKEYHTVSVECKFNVTNMKDETQSIEFQLNDTMNTPQGEKMLKGLFDRLQDDIANRNVADGPKMYRLVLEEV